MSGLGRLGRVVGGAGHGKAALLAGVSLVVLALPAFAAPWVIDANYTVSAAEVSADNVWVGFPSPDVVLAIDGATGPASLTITSGNSFYLGVGDDAHRSTTTLTGYGTLNVASLVASDQVIIGHGSDNNTMTLKAYSYVSGTSLVLGDKVGSDDNRLDLKNDTSVIELSSNLIIGNSGADNQVFLANGAELSADEQVILGLNAGASGNALTLSSEATVGADDGTALGVAAGGNTITVRSGADYTSYTTTLGALAGSDSNAFTVTGNGSTYTGTAKLLVESSFNVGDGGKNNSLLVDNGAVFDIGNRLALGKTIASTGNAVTVTGAGSELHAGNVRVGIDVLGSSGNSLIVADDGYVQVDSDIKIRGGNSIDLASGARLAMAGFTTHAGATFVLDVDAANAIDFNVTGLAELDGVLDANYSGGTLTNRYRVLSFGTLLNTMTVNDDDLAPGFTATLDAEGNVLYLDIVADLGGTADLGQNQANLAGAVNDAFADGAELSAAFVDLFGIADPDLDAALAGLSGEINAYVQTELGWSATEAALGMLTGPDLCVPTEAGGVCVKAFASGGVVGLDGDADAGNHDTAQSGLTLGLAAATLLGSDTLVSGLVTIDQTRAEIDGLGTADVTGLRFGASIKQSWQVFYASLGAAGGIGMGKVSRDFSSVGSASADLAQAYFGARGEIGADLALGEVILTPFAALDSANTSTGAYGETASGQFADLALAYGDNSQARTSAEIGLRLATTPSDTGLTLGGTVAYRHVLAADNAVETRFAALDSAFAVTPATAPADLLRLSVDATLPLAEGISLSGQIDASFADGYQAVSGKVGLFGEW